MFCSSLALAGEESKSLSLEEQCTQDMKSIMGTKDGDGVNAACKKVEQLEDCKSTSGSPIYHLNRKGTDPHAKKILAISLIHGDEVPAGSVTNAWMTRLQKIDPRNSWRVIPLVNPDGFKANTRTNGNGVDLNRNFPTHDWDELAIKYWKTRSKADPRRDPGKSGASEIETRCIMKHIVDFEPDFIISIHTPLGVLDFDGPKIKDPPKFRPLPWISLGNFPGSLGRYMWHDQNVPVLTIELKGNAGVKSLESFDRLQDITGTVALQSGQLIKSKK